jgi:ABC-2 type transport system ATP-binding protein
LAKAGKIAKGSGDDGANMIVARGLTKRFGQIPAVNSISFDIPRGQVVGVLGPNGAGKTTTIRMIAGYLTPTAGSVTVDGLDVVKDSFAVRRRIGYLPESAPLYAEMRVREFLQFRAKLFDVERSKRARSIDLAIRRCGLDEVQRRPIHQLSKGFRQRVGLAAALVHSPPLLILDEPTAGLDPSQILAARALIRELAHHHTVLLSTHILPEVELTCDRVLMIARGSIRASGTLEQVRSSAAGARNMSRYFIETSLQRAEHAIRQMPGVADVQSMTLNDRWKRLTITSNVAHDLRETLASALGNLQGQDGSATVREIHREEPTLEHLFVQMIAEAEAEHATAGHIEAAA